VVAKRAFWELSLRASLGNPAYATSTATVGAELAAYEDIRALILADSTVIWLV
jgi:hypothetical protein